MSTENRIDEATVTVLSARSYNKIAQVLAAGPNGILLPPPGSSGTVTAMLAARAELHRGPMTTVSRTLRQAMLAWLGGTALVTISRDPGGGDDYLLEAAVAQLYSALSGAVTAHDMQTRY
ncbi:hypothetical protein [Nocardia sp. NPDC050435]|uniref:hypothetical protein n=1 Tax=Nocardia sp. NPDC050435 TaxID=3155040 RepID=UPI0033C203F8